MANSVFRSWRWLCRLSLSPLEHFESFIECVTEGGSGSWTATQMGGHQYVNSDASAVRQDCIGGQLELNGSVVSAIGWNAIKINERCALGGSRGSL